MSNDPIAIIGIGCRYPGDITSPQTFWDFISHGRDAVQHIPKERKTLWSVWGYEHDYPEYGGFIDHIDHFDAAFFQISPREAKHIDPQQRLLLELAWEALEDAGLPTEHLSGRPIGVFIGIFLDEYWDLQRYTDSSLIDVHTNTGGTMSIAANRISYAFDFKGPSLSVDTACSSSLTAIHLACRSLYNNECDVALAGGVNLILTPQTTRGFNKARMLSPDGRCRAFDAGANGYGRSDGAGLVVLKPLDRAKKEGDPIYAVIHGSAINQDGRTQGLTQPDTSAQEAVIHAASQVAGITADQLTYVEAHGTGTPIGDPLEARAIGQATGSVDPCFIGSVKTNIGHTEAAAGVAGLIKTALSLKHRMIPPSLHLDHPNPDIPFDTLNLQVVTDLMPITGHAYAGVNSFGFGGANAHVILGSPPDRSTAQSVVSPPFLLPISAEQPEALHKRIQQVGDWVDAHKRLDLYPLAATLGERRHHHSYRAALVCSVAATASRTLSALRPDTLSDQVVTGRVPESPAPIVFVLTGMGPQWWGMGHSLYHNEPVFREAVGQCDEIFRHLTDQSILDNMLAGEADSFMAEPEVSQPANLILQWALYRLWTSWGIEPDMVIGHSVGEIAAACITGAISLDDALRIIYHRSLLQQQSQGPGAMLAAGMSPEEAQEIIRPYENRLSLAAVNSPISVTFSGEKDAIKRLERQIQNMDLYCTRLHVDVAYHSPLMDPHHDPFLEAIGALTLQPHDIPMISTVTGELVDGLDLTPEHWWNNIRLPVRFDAACAHLPEAQNLLLIQLGPHPVLSLAISENLAHHGWSGWPLSSLQRGQDERETMLKTLAHCYIHGRSIIWKHLCPAPYTPVQLPTYPWQRKKFWLTPGAYRSGVQSTNNMLFLDDPVISSIHVDTLFWETRVNLQQYPFLQDHRVQNKQILPMACLIEMLLETQDNASHSFAFRSLTILNPLFISTEDRYTIQVSSINNAFTISSRLSDAQDRKHTWQSLATASLLSAGQDPINLKLDDLQDPYTTLDGRSFYTAIADQGYAYGLQFQLINRISYSETEAIAQIQRTETERRTNRIHPCLLDAAIQSFILLLPEQLLCLPISVDTIRYHHAVSSETDFQAFSKLNDVTDQQIYGGDIVLFNGKGQALLELRGIRFRAVEKKKKTDVANASRPWLYRERWVPVDILVKSPFPEERHWIIINNALSSGDTIIKVCADEQAVGEIMTCSPDVLLRSPQAFEQFIHDYNKEEPGRSLGVLFFVSVDEPEETSLPVSFHAGEVLHLLQGLLNSDLNDVRLWLITTGGQCVERKDKPSLSQASIWGLGRVISREHPELGCTLVDIPRNPDAFVFQDVLDLLKSASFEMEYGIRNHKIYRRRLLPVDPSQFEPIELSSDGFKNTAYQLAADPPGAIENLLFHHSSLLEPAPDEVTLRVLATGLNFRDVMTALGLLPIVTDEIPSSVGWECVGEIMATGTQVNRVQVGDMVVAIAPGCFGRYAVTKESLVVAKPDNLSIEETVSLPIAFITAYYSLVTLGRIEHHERVLIHAATGAVGLAAIQLAGIWDAEIFATAGSPEKRRYLREMGIPHVMDSRTTDFADEIIKQTANKGVDLVLSAIAGEGMRRSLSVLAPYGRFIEIGKTDILRHQSIDLNHFEQNISYHVVDLARLTLDRPDQVGEMLRRVISMAVEGKLRPIPTNSIPIQEVQSAFRTMSQARHIGKLVVTANDHPVPLRLKAGDPVIKPEATYLITGGLGGIGQVLTGWLLEKGARHIVLLGRREIDESRLKALTEGLAADTRIQYIQVDVTDYAALQQIISTIQVDGPPLRGIFHCAGVLDDGLLMNYDASRLERIMAPKTIGAWNIHLLTKSLDLDLFVLFSSVASAVGTAGQGGYASANACLDALAARRQASGLPGISINWGPWAHTGMTADDQMADRLKKQGLHLIPPEKACDLLDQLLPHAMHHVCVMPLDGDEPRILKDNPLFMEIAEDHPEDPFSSTSAYAGTDFKSMPNKQQRRFANRIIREAVGQVADLDGATIKVDQSWRSLGVDSLMAVELRHRLESRLDVSIPVTDFQSSKAIRDTIDWIVEAWGRASE